MPLLKKRKKNESNVRGQVNYLQKACCPGQFRALSALAPKSWTKRKEHDIDPWFKEEYLAGDWKHWYYSASKSPGVTLNQNPVEAHNRDNKRIVGPDKYAATEVVLRTTLPRLLAYFGSARDRKSIRIHGTPIKPYSTGPVFIECARKAMLLAKEGNRRELEKNGTVVGLLFNTRKYLIGDTSIEPTRVDEDRATTFKTSLGGVLEKQEIVQNVYPRYLSLHLVRVEVNLPFTRSWDSPNWPESEVCTTTVLFCGNS
ncbi:hypothetical protein ON010_g14317 [Phytophthora cinnamomi]|nr:hypothetical protein ON010_g14317 [Phytophthora cinnamomi]